MLGSKSKNPEDLKEELKIKLGNAVAEKGAEMFFDMVMGQIKSQLQLAIL